MLRKCHSRRPLTGDFPGQIGWALRPTIGKKNWLLVDVVIFLGVSFYITIRNSLCKELHKNSFQQRCEFGRIGRQNMNKRLNLDLPQHIHSFSATKYVEITLLLPLYKRKNEMNTKWNPTGWIVYLAVFSNKQVVITH